MERLKHQIIIEAFWKVNLQTNLCISKRGIDNIKNKCKDKNSRFLNINNIQIQVDQEAGEE